MKLRSNGKSLAPVEQAISKLSAPRLCNLRMPTVYIGGIARALRALHQPYDFMKDVFGDIYAIPEPKTTETAVQIFKSTDGARSFIAFGDPVACDVSAGERIDQIYQVLPTGNFLVLKTTVAYTHNYVLTYDPTMTNLLGTLDIGTSLWASRIFNITNRNSQIVMAEYSNLITVGTVKLWLSENDGVTWSDYTSALPHSDVRHFHVVQYDPYDSAIWLGSGDLNANCWIQKSVDNGYTWANMGGGDQTYRTLGFAFTETHVYWGMDNGGDTSPTRIYKAPKTDLSQRVVVATIPTNTPIYGFSRTFYPSGVLVWTCKEPTSSHVDNTVYFFDFAEETLKPVARFPKGTLASDASYGVIGGQRFQHNFTGDIIFEVSGLNSLDINKGREIPYEGSHIGQMMANLMMGV